MTTTSYVVPGPGVPHQPRRTNIRKWTSLRGLPDLGELLAQRDRLHLLRVKRSTPIKPSNRTKAHLFLLYNWFVWLYAMLVIMTQVLCIFRASFEYSQTLTIGQSPLLGPYKVLGENDRPYSDRCVVCVRLGRVYKRVLVRDALGSIRGVKIDPFIASSIHGYRVVSRDDRVMSKEANTFWTNTCALLAATLSDLVESCNSLGYNATDTRLHIVDEDDRVWHISDSLPIVIVPIADNTLFGRYILASSSGSSCALRLEGAYETPSSNDAWLVGVDRAVIERKIQLWLGIRNGKWRHGWLEDDDTSMKWYSDMMNSRQSTELSFLSRRFNGWTGREVNCTARSSDCAHSALDFWWGDTLHTTQRFSYLQVVLAGNGLGDGLFFMDNNQTLQTWNVYSLALLISNSSIIVLLLHWFVAISALHKYYYIHSNEDRVVGIGIISNASGFRILPFLLLPRLRTALTALFTAGCAFEGDQMPLSEAWFVIYPGIAETLLFLFGAINLFAKLLRRRVSDVLFGPTLVFICALHLLRQPWQIQSGSGRTKSNGHHGK